MNHYGKCLCGGCNVCIDLDVDISELTPRICDCDFCQLHPSQALSFPTMVIDISSSGADFKKSKNGSGQATFYQCQSCCQVLAVGAVIDGKLRGAVNALLFTDCTQLKNPEPIQPRLLSAKEKAKRWASIWGQLKVTVA